MTENQILAHTAPAGPVEANPEAEAGKNSEAKRKLFFRAKGREREDADRPAHQVFGCEADKTSGAERKLFFRAKGREREDADRPAHQVFGCEAGKTGEAKRKLFFRAKGREPEGTDRPMRGAADTLIKNRRNKKAVETVFEIIFIVCALVAVVSVVLITAYMIFSGGPAIAKIGVGEFLFGEIWAPTAADPKFGILPMILASLYGTLGAIVVGVPIGLLTSVFIAEIAPKRLRGVLRGAVELLAGIPSVIYGLIGMIVIVPLVARIFSLPLGMCLFSAILILAVMVLPTIVNISEFSLKAVPRELSEASLALGATQMQTIFRVQIPAARSGIMTGVVLGVGRAVGETMAVIMVAGNVVNMPELLGSVRLMTTGIVQEMSYSSGLHREALFAIGLVLFLFIMLLNLILSAVLKKGAR